MSTRKRCNSSHLDGIVSLFFFLLFWLRSISSGNIFSFAYTRTDVVQMLGNIELALEGGFRKKAWSCCLRQQENWNRIISEKVVVMHYLRCWWKRYLCVYRLCDGWGGRKDFRLKFVFLGCFCIFLVLWHKAFSTLVHLLLLPIFLHFQKIWSKNVSIMLMVATQCLPRRRLPQIHR